jgi:DNA (cytosine-5)-methyltransferase 1
MTTSRSNPRQQKLQRVRAGGKIRVLDLFAGCGGLSLGFLTAGFEIVASVELDELAARSHATNFFRGADSKSRKVHSQARDITRIEPEELLIECGCKAAVENAIDVVIGGPPCQAFARVGRAKLREVAEHPHAFKQDPRGNLYLRFLDYIRKLQPIAILMENVPDVINYGGHNIPEETSEVLQEMGYTAGYTLLNSAFYGVPQMRERMFLIAYAKELKASVAFPQPTHHVDLPRGYEGSRQVALKNIQVDLLRPEAFFIEPPMPNRTLPPAVSAAEALSDLPPITAHLEGLLKRGARRFDTKIPYLCDPTPGSFPEKMRVWKGFEANGGIADHAIRSLPRDYAIFRRMNPGDQYPEAHNLALRMLDEALAKLKRKGRAVQPGSMEYTRLKAQIVPPYDPTKFPNKWRKMEPDQPARTLMAHLGKDSYSHIHHDSAQARTISVREAARLQSFPDGFVFEGTMNPAFRQIGNAVPPLLAAAIASVMHEALTRIPHEKETRR